MATIEQRLSALERAITTAPWLVLDVTDYPTPEQAEQIATAERTGHMMIVFCARGNTAWITGCGKPAPWEKQGCGYANN